MKRNFRQSIKIGFKSLEDLFNLPCVKGLVKDSAVEGGIRVNLWPSKMADGITPLAYKGQWLSEDFKGKWYVTDNEQ